MDSSKIESKKMPFEKRAFFLCINQFYAHGLLYFSIDIE